MQVQGSDMHDIVALSRQEGDGFGRDAAIGNGSGADRGEFVPGEGRGVGERLADVLEVEIGQVVGDLRRRDAVGDQVDDMRNGDPQPTHGRAPAQAVRLSPYRKSRQPRNL